MIPIPPTKVITEDRMKMKGLGQIGRLSGRHHQDRRESPLQDFWRQFLNSHCRLLLKENVTEIKTFISSFRLRVFPIIFCSHLWNWLSGDNAAVDTKLPMTMLTLKGTAAWEGLSQKTISRYSPFKGIGKIQRCQFLSPLSWQVLD